MKHGNESFSGRRRWEAIARDLAEEQDPERVSELIRELNDAMFAEERARVRSKGFAGDSLQKDDRTASQDSD
jgi:hypothetical protein